MRIPEQLKPGDTIAIVAPSFGATTDPYTFRFEEAVRQFKNRGYRVVIGDCCYKSDGLGISTHPETAAQELMYYYMNPDIHAVFSCGGGELMCETVQYIDFEMLRSAPAKWFLGYSDNTNFIFPLVTLCNTAALYGPNAPGFGKPWEQAEYYVWDILEGKTDTVHGYEMFQNPDVESEDPLSPYILTDTKELTVYVPDEKNPGTLKKLGDSEQLTISGTILGGCLDCINGLSGTPFENVKDFNLNHKNVIWTLECCDYNPMDIRRALWHLKQCGWFKNASGFVFGRPLAAFRQEMMGVNQYNAVTGILEDFGVPVIFDADFGHIDPVMPLIIGADATVKVKGDDISIKFNI